MNRTLTAAQLAHRAQVIATYPPAFRLEAAVCFSILLSFAAYLLSVAL